MELERTDAFEASYHQLPPEIRRRVDKALRWLAANPRHPSLRSKIVDPRHRLWQARVTRGYRMYFTMEEGVITLHLVKPHD